MLSFKQHFVTSLEEALITFGGKAYPKFGQVVILAGGAGSGKGFVKTELLGIEGFSFDVDELKLLVTRTPAILKKVKDEFGFDLSELDPVKNPTALKNPENVFKLHTIVGDGMFGGKKGLSLDDKKKSNLYSSILTAAADRKPNLIFDVTMKSMTQLQKYTLPIKNLGYKNENIHLVWIVNDIEVAKVQNLERARTVPVEILVSTHQGASQTMKDIVSLGNELRKYLDGDIVFAFNKVGIDTEIQKSASGGKYIKKANYVYVKRQGSPVDASKFTADMKAKIASYVPKNVNWEDL
jgi:hypothetical protein